MQCTFSLMYLPHAPHGAAANMRITQSDLVDRLVCTSIVFNPLSQSDLVLQIGSFQILPCDRFDRRTIADVLHDGGRRQETSPTFERAFPQWAIVRSIREALRADVEPPAEAIGESSNHVPQLKISATEGAKD